MNRIINYLSQLVGNDQANFPGLFKRTNKPVNLELAIIQANHGVIFDPHDASWTLDWKRI